MILVPNFELIGTLKLIAKLKPTMMPGVPTLYNAMIRHPHISNFDLSSLEFCISGGAALPLEVKRGFEAICACNLVEGYGLCETLSGGHLQSPARRQGGLDRPAAAGHEDEHQVARGSAREMPLGEPGELCIAGPQVMSGYWNKPEDTAKASFVGAFLPHRRCRLHGRRRLHLHRRPHQGHDQRLGLQGLSAAHRRCACTSTRAVEEVTVVGVPDAYRGEAPKAFVKLKAGTDATAADLLALPQGEAVASIEMPPRSSSATSCRRP